MKNNEYKIGPFFYINNKLVTHAILIEKGTIRGDKIDNPYSHEKLYDDNFKCGDYINYPRGRVVWDTKQNLAIIYIDICIEKDSVIEKIKELFNLDNYVLKHDEHYVCPKCMGDIWD